MLSIYAALKVARKSRSGLASAKNQNNVRNNKNGNGNEQYHVFPEGVEWDNYQYRRGFEYQDDNGAAEDFFRRFSNFDELLRSLNYSQREAFRAWTRGELMDSEQWREWDNISGYTQRILRGLDSVVDKATLDRGIVITRAGSAELLLPGKRLASNLQELQSLVGNVVTAKGYMSFGAASEGLPIGSQKNVEYKVRVPAGSKGAGMWVGDSRVSDWGSLQREFLMSRDTSYRVDGVSYDSKRKKYIVDMTYMGKQKHDYGRSGR